MKDSNNKSERNEWTNQFNETVRSTTVNNNQYFITIDNDCQDELNDDFLFRYGYQNEEAKQALDILTK